MNNITILFDTIEKHTGLARLELRSAQRHRQFVDAREIFVRIARDNLLLTYPHIARLLSRDHSSIMHLYGRHRVSPQSFTQALASYVEKCQ